MGQSMSNCTKKMKKWKSSYLILMKLDCTIDILYESMKWHSSSVPISGLEVIKPYFPRLYLPCLSRYLKNYNTIFFTTPRTQALFLQLSWSEAIQIPTLWPLIYYFDYLKTHILWFQSYFYKIKSKINKVRCKRILFIFACVGHNSQLTSAGWGCIEARQISPVIICQFESFKAHYHSFFFIFDEQNHDFDFLINWLLKMTRNRSQEPEQPKLERLCNTDLCT